MTYEWLSMPSRELRSRIAILASEQVPNAIEQIPKRRRRYDAVKRVLQVTISRPPPWKVITQEHVKNYFLGGGSLAEWREIAIRLALRAVERELAAVRALERQRAYVPLEETIAAILAITG